MSFIARTSVQREQTPATSLAQSDELAKTVSGESDF
jgi:hypothetical protein